MGIFFDVIFVRVMVRIVFVGFEFYLKMFGWVLGWDWILYDSYILVLL